MLEIKVRPAAYLQREDFVEIFCEYEDVTVYLLDGRIIDGEIREVKDNSLVIDVNWKGKSEEFTFQEIDDLEHP